MIGLLPEGMRKMLHQKQRRLRWMWKDKRDAEMKGKSRQRKQPEQRHRSRKTQGTYRKGPSSFCWNVKNNG